MEKQNIRCLVVLGLVLCLGVTAVHSVTCYVCTSSTTKNCGDPFNPEGVKTQQCNGQCAKATVNQGGKTTTSRACIPTCQEGRHQGNSVSCCSSDKCNGATVPVATVAGVVVIFGCYVNWFL